MRGRFGEGASSIVIIESRIDTTGCIHDFKVIEGSRIGDLNRSALLALSQWTFTPATLDGKPVEVTFDLTINFKTR